MAETGLIAALCSNLCHTAWSMFADSRDALRPGGSLWVIGNRHLAYHAKLKRLFGDCDVVNANSKFVVLRSMKG